MPSPPAAPPSRREAWVACALLALVATAVFWPWVGQGRALYWGDFGVYFQPLLAFERAQLRLGTLPLWNPALFCGTPFFGNPQMWPLYPSTLLLPMLPASRFLSVSCVAHLALGGALFWGWLRRGAAALGPWPSLLGAVGWMLGGYFAAKAQYPNMLQALAWVPLVLLCAERLALRAGARAAWALGAALGMQLLAAHAQVTVYTAYLALGLGVFRLWGQPARAWRRCAGWGAVAAVLALGLSCGEWLPVLEAHRFAARQVLTLAQVNRLHLPWDETGGFVLPWRDGSPLRGDWSGAGPLWETACYMGLVTVALAIWAVVQSVRASLLRRETVFWLAVFAGSVWLALGAGGGLFRIAYALVPGMKLFHDPARLLLGATVALPLLAAMGLQQILALPRLSEARTRHTLGAVCVVLLILDVAPFDRALYPTQPMQVLEAPSQSSAVAQAVRTDPALLSGAGRVLALDNDAASVQFQSWTDYEAGLPKYVPRLASTFLPNLPLLAGLRDAGGYEPLALARPAQVAGAAMHLASTPQGANGAPSGTAAALLGAFSVRAVVAYRPQPPPPVLGLVPALAWADPAGVNHGFVRLNTAWLPRARVYSTWQAVRTGSSVDLPALVGNIPTVENAPAPPSTPPAPPRAAAIVRDTPDRVVVDMPAPASAQTQLLMLADTHFPGWAATVDNRFAPVLRADGVFRAVVVPPGARRVVFVYRPTTVQLGLYVSLLTTLLLIAGSVFVHQKETE